MMAAMSLRQVVVRRSRNTVLDGVSLDVSPGSVTGLLGPSGSGKTTLMRTVVGLQRVSAGSVRVLGRPAGHPRLRAEIGYMTQAPSVYGDLTVAQAALATTVALGLLGLQRPASVPVLLLLAVATAVLGSALGLGVSALAIKEFQAVQFMPAVVLPQVLLCGLFTPTENMAGWLQVLSRVIPLRYAADGMIELTGAATVPAAVWTNLAVVTGIAVLALGLGAATLRRRTG